MTEDGKDEVEVPQNSTAHEGEPHQETDTPMTMGTPALTGDPAGVGSVTDSALPAIPEPVDLPDWDPAMVFGDPAGMPEPEAQVAPAALPSAPAVEPTRSTPSEVEAPLEMPSWDPDQTFQAPGEPEIIAPVEVLGIPQLVEPPVGLPVEMAIDLPVDMPDWDPIEQFQSLPVETVAETPAVELQDSALPPFPEPPAVPAEPNLEGVGAPAFEVESTSAPYPPYPSIEQVIAEIDSVVQGGGTSLLEERGSAATKFQSTVAGEKHIVFSLAGTRYAVPLQHILEMDRVPGLTPVPNVPHWLLGVTNLRGDILSIIELRSFLEMPPPEFPASGRLLVARSLSTEVLTGLIVDRVHGLEAIPAQEIQPPSRLLEGKITSLLRGVYSRESGMVVVLDLERFFLSPEIRQFDAG